jgi:uncharacterized protein YggT (Ycf19 family)
LEIGIIDFRLMVAILCIYFYDYNKIIKLSSAHLAVTVMSAVITGELVFGVTTHEIRINTR